MYSSDEDASYGVEVVPADEPLELQPPLLALELGLALEPGAFDQPLFVGYPEPFGA